MELSSSVMVGTGVTEFAVGDRVFGSVDGAYEVYGIAPIKELVKMPERLTFEDAASIRASADTAWKALFTEGELEAGQTVLIHAAAGGVGQFAVQLAKWKGAKVIGTSSTANLNFVKSLCADQVIDYTATAFEEIVKEVDLVVDSVGGDTENLSDLRESADNSTIDSQRRDQSRDRFRIPAKRDK